MPRRWRRLVGGLSHLLGFAVTSPAVAHGFGQRYDLPIPLAFYIWGAGATVALSFVGFALFLRQEHEASALAIEWQSQGALVGAVVLIARALAVGMLILVIVAGLFGSQDPIRNIAPVMIWIVGWVGFGVLCLLLGDVWALLNPWNTVFAAAESSYRRIRAGATLGLGRRYPEWLGVWPAFVLFVLFAWMELVWSGRNVPAQLAAALLVYSGLTWLGMFVFGRADMARPRRGVYARLRDLCALRAVREDAGGPSRHPRAAAGGRLARESSLDDLDGRAGDCAAGDRHIRRFSRNAVMGVGSISPSSIGHPTWHFGRRCSLREDQAVRVVRTLALLGCVAPVSGSVCGRVPAHRGSFRRT